MLNERKTANNTLTAAMGFPSPLGGSGGEGQWKRDLIKFNYLHYCNRRPAVKLWRIRTFIIIIKYLKGRHKFSLVNIYFALPPPILFVPTLIRGDLSRNANNSIPWPFCCILNAHTHARIKHAYNSMSAPKHMLAQKMAMFVGFWSRFDNKGVVRSLIIAACVVRTGIHLL